VRACVDKWVEALKEPSEKHYKWQEIGSAPKNGKVVMVADKESNNVNMGYWSSVGNCWAWGYESQPTHWVDLEAEGLYIEYDAHEFSVAYREAKNACMWLCFSTVYECHDMSKLKISSRRLTSGTFCLSNFEDFQGVEILSGIQVVAFAETLGYQRPDRK